MTEYAVGAAFLLGMLVHACGRWVVTHAHFRKARCAWCDGPRSSPRRPVCDDCVRHDGLEMPGWQ